MKPRKLICIVAVALFAAPPTALASTKWYVNGVSGSDNNNCTSPTTACRTIKHAISLAASGDSIVVAPAIYTENLLTIGTSLKVIGSGANTAIIDGGGTNTVITISNTSAHVTISKVTIRNGAANFGAGVYNLGMLKLSHVILTGNRASFSCKNSCSAVGGGIYNLGTLTINHSTITQNSVQVTGCTQTGTFCFGIARGGGISTGGTLAINNTTISGNTTNSKCLVRAPCRAEGGGIYNTALATINTSTINENTASGFNAGYSGSGIYNELGGALTINNSTISGNSGPTAAIVTSVAMLTINNSTISENLGAGINSAATLQNSIVANNSGFNCEGPMTSNGYNLSSDNSCNFSNTGDLNNKDPLLGPLQDNGGPTFTQALLSGSPAIDAGNPAGCTDSAGHQLTTDQRGKPRPDTEDSGGCDIGAYERQND